MEKTKDKVDLFLLIFLELATTIIREIMGLLPGNDQAKGIVNIVIIVLMGLLAFILGIRCHNCRRGSSIVWFLQLVAVVMYHYGNNINFTIQRYSTSLDCGEKCMESSHIASRILLGCATLILTHIRSPSTRLKVNKLEKYSHYCVDMVTALPKINAYYAIAVSLGADCSQTHNGLKWLFFCIFALCGWIMISYNYIQARLNKVDCNDERSLRTILALSVVCLPIYMLADNQQPLDCTTNCIQMTNGTIIPESEKNCKTNHIVRLVFIASVALLLGIACYVITNMECIQFNQVHTVKSQDQPDSIKISTTQATQTDTEDGNNHSMETMDCTNEIEEILDS